MVRQKRCLNSSLSALKNWMQTNMKDHRMPPVNITTEQQTEISSIIESITTYRAEMLSKFIMGVEPIENFEEFRSQLKQRGLDKYIEYYQQAYDRFVNR